MSKIDYLKLAVLVLTLACLVWFENSKHTNDYPGQTTINQTITFPDPPEKEKEHLTLIQKIINLLCFWKNKSILNNYTFPSQCENLSVNESGRLKDGNETIAIVYTDESVYCESAGGGYQSIKEFEGVGCCDWKEIELIKKIYKNDEDFDISDCEEN